MEEKNIQIRYLHFDSIGQLPDADRSLFEKALETADTAYAPYSKYSVGAAVKLTNGKIVTGSNQENMAYPSGLCAERVAIFSAASQFPKVPIESIAVAVKPSGDDPQNAVSPCGACRQVILEYERILKNPIRIISGSEKGPITVFENAQSLLPMAFFDAGLAKSMG